MKSKLSHINEAQSLSKKRFGKETWQLDSEEKLQFAIENCRRIRITYDDKKGGKGKNTRYLLPLVYGITKNGKKAIRAFQTFGSTKRGVPKYKLFLFDNIKSIEVGKIKYYDYAQKLLSTGFNTAGDKSFADIYAITPLATDFNGANLANRNEPIDANPVKKQDISKSTEPTKKETPITKSQQPQQQAPKTIDNLNKTDIFKNKIEAPDTKPVSKGEIDTGENPQSQIQPTQEPTNNGEETAPVTKSDIEHPQINTDNELSNSYRDMMNRMDNLYKDDDENDEDNL